MQRILYLILVCFLFSGCKAMPLKMKPLGYVFQQIPEDAPEIFKTAWRHGCSSGFSSMTNSFYRSHYEFVQDPELRKDPVYYKVWKDTFTFCRHYAYGVTRQSDIRMQNANSIPDFLNTMFGSKNILEHGLLNLTGPGKSGLMLENWGYTGGDSSFETLNGEWDFTDDMIFNGKKGGLVWDFRPQGTSIAPWHTDIEAWKSD